MTAAPVRPHVFFDVCGEEVAEDVLEHEWTFEPEETLEKQDGEAQLAIPIKDPGAPTPAEIAEHELTHLPHRSWCSACVAGRARDRPHKRSAGKDGASVPCVVFDYGFMGGVGDDETVAIQIARDVDTKMLFAHVVPRKGLVANHGVTQLMKDIDRLGHKKVCLKCDGEPALVAIQDEVKKQRIDETLVENSPAGDSCANGIAERAVQSVAEQIRVLRASLETKINAKLPGTHAVTTWLVEHCADLLNKYQLGDDGRTAYHRLRGKIWKHEMVEFGEKVHYRVNMKSLPKEYKLEGRWGEGFFMGVKWRTGESWVATTEGIVKTSAIRRVGGHRRWDAEGLLSIKGVPWDHVQKDAIPGEVRVQWLDPPLVSSPAHAQEEEPRRRRVRINKEDLYKHGFTEGCLGCRSIIRGGDPRGHTEACRNRLEEAMKGTEAGRAKVQKAKDRLDSEMARYLERELEKEQEKPDPKKLKREDAMPGGSGSASSGGAVEPPSRNQPARPAVDSGVDALDPTKRSSDTSSDEHSAKRPRSDQDMELSQLEVNAMERMMQEDFRWPLHSVSDMCEAECAILKHAVVDMTYHDENTGEVLDQRLVREGEEEELSRFKKMGVYGYVDRQDAVNDPEGVFVNVKWVRVNKGTKQRPQIKCRLVAQELAYGVRMDELYANTPSLSCVKLAMLFAAQSGKGRKLMTLDVKSAFLYGAARRKIYIELPSADPHAGGSTVGVLYKALYGTRDAPQIWQHEVRGTLKRMGFMQSALQPSVYFHHERDILLMVHVDDFLVAASQESLEWVYDEMSKSYELKQKIISSSPDDAHSTSYLNRRIKWDVHNWMSYEGDTKHVERLLKEWGLVACKSVSATLTKELEDKVGEGPNLSDTEGRRVRQSIARINFMSQDRPDLCCVARVLSKHMSAPTVGTRNALQHVVKYLKGHPRCVNHFYADIPPEQYKLDAFCDSDWANDKVARRSCSGGVLVMAGVPVGFWSKTQSNIALSSGEAELNSCVKTISEMLGIINLWDELFGEHLCATLHVDSSACRGMVLRSGTGKVKHLSTKQLWVQAAVEAFPLKVVKIPRAANCSDMLTHCISEGEARAQLKKMSFMFVS